MRKINYTNIVRRYPKQNSPLQGWRGCFGHAHPSLEQATTCGEYCQGTTTSYGFTVVIEGRETSVRQVGVPAAPGLRPVVALAWALAGTLEPVPSRPRA